MKVIAETDEECNSKMQKGYDDMIQGKVKPLKDFGKLRKPSFNLPFWFVRVKTNLPFSLSKYLGILGLPLYLEGFLL